MKQEAFNDCMAHYEGNSDTTWNELAKKHGYCSDEAIRSAFKRLRKKLKIPNNTTQNKKQINRLKKQAVVPKVVCFDIETTPMLVYTFGLYDNYISPDHIAFDSMLLSWSAKELNDSVVRSDILTEDEALTMDDRRIVESIWDYLSSADILIGHNIRDYDLKYINARFIYYGLKPIGSKQIVDTLLESRKNFRFASHKLGYINKHLGIKQKLETGMGLWIGCMNGDKKSLLKMNEYCDADVVAVEELYYKIRPFITGHPNIGLYMDSKDSVCPNCGSCDIVDNGYYMTNVNKYKSYRCSNCGAISRQRTSTTDKEVKKSLLRN